MMRISDLILVIGERNILGGQKSDFTQGEHTKKVIEHTYYYILS